MSKDRNRGGKFKFVLLAVLAGAHLMQLVTVATAAGYSLTTNIAGSGSINNVQQNSPAFACASPSTNCSVTSPAGTSFTLSATPSQLFDFAGWSGAGCNTGPCQLKLNGNTNVTATFSPQQLLQLVGRPTPYMSFPAVYSDASNGSEIRSRNAIINGDLRLNRDVSVKLNGGYADKFTTISGLTTIQGALTIQRGRAIVNKIRIGLKAVADFTLEPPAAIAVAQGISGTSTIKTTVSGGFNAAVAFTASGLPTGASATFLPASIPAPGSGSATLTLTAGPATPVGTYTIALTGTGGGKTHNSNVLFTVTAGAGSTTTLLSDGFEAGGWSTAQVSGADGSWAMVAAGAHPVALPHGGAMLADFNAYTSMIGNQTRLYRTSGIAIPGTITSATLGFWMYHDTGWADLNDQVQVQVSTNGTSWTNLGAPVSRYDGTTGWAKVTIDLSAYKGQTVWLGFTGISNYGMDIYLDDVSVTAQGTASPDFSLTTPPVVSAARGGSGKAIISTTATDGFNSVVALTTTGLPPGATAALSPTSIGAPGSGSATLTLSASATTPMGTHVITVTGAGGGKTHSANLSFTVADPTIMNFSGDYTGSYTGSDSGSIMVTLAADGGIVGTVNSISDAGNVSVISGAVTVDGKVNMQSSASAGTVTYVGTVTSQGGLTGTWSGTTPSGATGSGSLTMQNRTNDTQRLEDITVAGLNSHQQGGTLVLVNSVGDILPISQNGSYSFPTPLTDVARLVRIATQPAGQSCAFTKKRQDHFDPYTEQLITPLTSDIYCFESPCGSMVSLGGAPAPTGLQEDPTQRTDTSVRLDWQDSPWAATYNVFYGTDPVVVVNNAVSMMTDYQRKSSAFYHPRDIINLEPGTRYYFAITSMYFSPSNLAYCQSSVSSVISVTTDITCAAPLISQDGECVNPAPYIWDFDPMSGEEGTVVTITGSRFSATPAENTVRFNGTQATVTAATTTSLTVKVPAGATTGAISVTTPGGTTTTNASSYLGTFTVNPRLALNMLKIDQTPLHGYFTFNAPPTPSLYDGIDGITTSLTWLDSTAGVKIIVSEKIMTNYTWIMYKLVDITNDYYYASTCTSVGISGYEGCTTKGVNFDKTAGTVSFAETDYPTLTGTLKFTPY